MPLDSVETRASIIEFEDKHNFPPYEIPFSNEPEIQPEEIRCNIPELEHDEKIILNAWGSWEVHHYDDYRRRLGIYQVTSKEGDEHMMRYVLREETKFSEREIVSKALSGRDSDIQKDLRYIELDRN